MEISRRQRLVFVLLIVGAATCVALVGQHSFLNAFKSFILFLLAFFTPWSAVNLVDYYFINQMCIRDSVQAGRPAGALTRCKSWCCTG